MLRGAHAEASTWLSLVLEMDGEAPPLARTVVTVAHALNGGASGAVGPPALVDGGDEIVRFAVEHADEHPLLMLVEPGVAMLERRLHRCHRRHRAALGPGGAVDALGAAPVRRAARRERGRPRPRPAGVAAGPGGVPGGRRPLGDGGALGSLSAILPFEGRLEEAVAMAEEASVCMRELGAVDDAASLRLRALMLRARLGEGREVREAIEAFVRDADEQVSRQSLAFAYSGLAELDRREGHPEAARAHALEGLARVDGVAGQPPQIEAIVCACRACVDAALGRLDDARAWLRRPQVAAAVAFDMPVAAMVAVAAAEVVLAAGDATGAARLLGAADALRGSADASVSDADGLLAS